MRTRLHHHHHLILRPPPLHCLRQNHHLLLPLPAACALQKVYAAATAIAGSGNLSQENVGCQFSESYLSAVERSLVASASFATNKIVRTVGIACWARTVLASVVVAVVTDRY